MDKRAKAKHLKQLKRNRKNKIIRMQKVAETRRKKLQKTTWQVVELRVSKNLRNSLILRELRRAGLPAPRNSLIVNNLHNLLRIKKSEIKTQKELDFYLSVWYSYSCLIHMT